MMRSFELTKTSVYEAETGNGLTRYLVHRPLSDAMLPGDVSLVFIGGQQSPLERLYSASEYFASFGKTYTYEVLGLGARVRQSFETATNAQIGREIALFLKQEVREKNIILIAASGGMFNISELLQHDEAIRFRVVGVVSIVGIVSKDTIGLPPWLRSLALGVLNVLLHRRVTTLITRWFRNNTRAEIAAKVFLNIKGIGHLDKEQKDLYLRFLVYMWQHQDWATNMFTLKQYITSSIPPIPRLSTPLLSMYSKNDEYFSFSSQKRDIESVYSDVQWIPLENIGHAPIYEPNPLAYESVAPRDAVITFFNRCLSNRE